MSDLCLVLSDLHAGKTTRTYDVDVCRKRLESYVEKLLVHPGRPRKVNRIWIFLLGDLVDGSGIFPHQDAVNDEDVPTQVAVVFDGIKWIVDGLLSEFPGARVRIVCVEGNHGRISKTANPRSNWDRMVHMMLGQEYAYADWAQVIMSNDEFYSVDVAGTRGVLAHIGVPHINTPARMARFLGWMHEFEASWLVVAHMHHIRLTIQNNCIFLGNGSLCGTDELSTKLGLFSKPQQLFFSVEKGRGIYGIDWIQWD